MKDQSTQPVDPTETLRTLSSLEDFTALRKLHNLGANLNVLIKGDREEFIDNLHSHKLQRLFLSTEIIQDSGTLNVVIQQLSKYCLGYRVHACRGESKHEMKDHNIWSSGLIEAEAENNELIHSITEVLGLEKWHNRHEVLSQSPENYLVLTL